MTLTTDDSENRFIFTDKDFEDDSFNPAQFVARYRRVAPLDSLKDQLRSYSLNIKDQLYEIINKDYKNFIKIATKLDGMDVRIEKLRQPIVNIRMDISSLHDLLLTSLKSIQDKLDEKEKIRARRVVLEGCLYCMNKLDAADDILNSSSSSSTSFLASTNNVHDTESQLAPTRRELLGLLNQVHTSNIHHDVAVITNDITPTSSSSSTAATTSTATTVFSTSALNLYSSSGGGSGLTRDIFDSSEYERAAATLASVRGCLVQLQSHSAAVAVSGHAALLRQLEQKCTRLIDTLVMKVRARLCAMFSDDNIPVPRSLTHCLRALMEINRGVEAESAFAETVTLPLAKSLLTQGKIDGDGGRGSYAGLADTLLTLITRISTRHAETLRTCENMFTFDATISSLSLLSLSVSDADYAIDSTDNITDTESLKSSNSGGGSGGSNTATADTISSLPHDIDLLMSGVWAPVINVLSEKFPGMFSVGIASTFATCYLSIQSFAAALCGVLEVNPSSSSSSSSLHSSPSLIITETATATPLLIRQQQLLQRESVLRRLLAHPSTHSFDSQWRLPLYLQLRIQEVGGAVDKLCDLSRSLGPTHSTLSLSELTLTVTVTQSVPPPTAATAASPAPVSQSKSNTKKQPIATPAPAPVTQNITTTTPALASILSLTEIETLQSQLHISSVFATPLIRSMATLASLPLHSRVLLSPLAGHLFTLSLRVLCRLEAHLVSVLGIHTNAFPATSGSGAEVASFTESGLQSASNTPLKRTGSLPQVILTPLTAIGGSGNQSLHTVDDLLKLCTDLCRLITWLRSDYTQYTRIALTQSPYLSLTATAAEGMIDTCVKSQCNRIDEMRQSVWQRICILLGNDCTAALTGVAAVTARYRMTNKPPPVQPSPYTHDLLQPLVSFRNQHAHAADICSAASSCHSAYGINQTDMLLSVSSGQQQWVAKVVQLISSQYLTRVQALIETVRSMDAALNKRAKLKPTATTGVSVASVSSLSDSEKILLQLYLDVQSFRSQVVALGVNVNEMSGVSVEVPSLEPLTAAVAEGGKFVVVSH